MAGGALSTRTLAVRPTTIKDLRLRHLLAMILVAVVGGWRIFAHLTYLWDSKGDLVADPDRSGALG